MKQEGLMFILCPKNWSNSQFSCHRMNVRALPFILCPKLQKRNGAADAGGQGMQGAQGCKGDKGMQGMQRMQGMQGCSGCSGCKGCKGAQGVQIGFGAKRRREFEGYAPQWEEAMDHGLLGATTQKGRRLCVGLFVVPAGHDPATP